MKVLREAASLSFRKEDFDITYHFFECEDSKERYTDDVLDQINTIQVHNRYREKYGIPFPEEIKNIRMIYGISANKMSEILGLGTNSYRLYESGDMPSVAIGRLILSIKDPIEFIKQVRASAHIIKEKESEKLIKFAEQLIADREEKKRQRKVVLEKKEIPGELNGYKALDLDKISGIISFYNKENGISLCKTKLNKLLFYSDFQNYQRYGYSMSGITYQAIQYGPVPYRYDKLYVKLSEIGKLSIEEKEYGEGIFGDDIKSIENFDRELFEDSEFEILSCIVNSLGKMTTKQIVDKSHNELAWKENHQTCSLISYKYAFSLTEQLSLKVLNQNFCEEKEMIPA